MGLEPISHRLWLLGPLRLPISPQEQIKNQPFTGVEPAAFCLPCKYSTTELKRPLFITIFLNF